MDHSPSASGGRPEIIQKVTRRLIPFVGICYLIAYIDRQNVSFAKLQMVGDLGLSEYAYATESGAIPVIDERKAKRICRERYPQVLLGCTVDLFTHPAVEASLGQSGLRDAVFAALQHARMRVLPQHIEWVVRLIGEDRARDCPSLPRAARTKGMASSDVR
jgi:hypothetical protein